MRRTFSWGGFPGPLAVPLVAVVATAWLLSLNLSVALHGYGATALKAYHPVFMVLGVTLLLPLALVASLADFGPAGNASCGRAARRRLHAALAAAGSVCVLVGFGIHFYLNQSGGTAHLPSGEPASHSPAARTAHVIIGYAVVAAVALQVAGGVTKLVRAPAKVLPQHGLLGLATFVAGCACIAIAAYFEYAEYKYQPAGTTWTLGEASVVWVALAALLAAVLGNRSFANKDHVADDDAQPLEEDGGAYDALGAQLQS
jgi:hypothetical protein